MKDISVVLLNELFGFGKKKKCVALYRSLMIQKGLLSEYKKKNKDTTSIERIMDNIKKLQEEFNKLGCFKYKNPYS